MKKFKYEVGQTVRDMMSGYQVIITKRIWYNRKNKIYYLYVPGLNTEWVAEEHFLKVD